MRLRGFAGLVAVLAVMAGCSTSSDDSWPAGASASALPAGVWTPLPASPLSARHDAVTAWVGNRFLVLGGRTDRPCAEDASCAGPLQPAERDGASFDPATGRWTGTTESPAPVSGSDAVVVDDTLYVLVAKTTEEAAAFLRYSPTRGWDALELPAKPTATLVAGKHTVYAVPEYSDGKKVRIQAYDVGSGDTAGPWRTLPADPLGAADFRQATWSGDRLLVAGPPLASSAGSAKTRITWWNPSTQEWTDPKKTDVTGWDPTAVGDLVVWPGNGTGATATGRNWTKLGRIYDPAAGTWTTLPTPLDGDGLEHASGLVVGSRIVASDPATERHTGRGNLLDPATRTWTALPPLPGPTRSSAGVAANDDEILVWGGGSTDQTNLSDGYLLRP